MNNTIRKALFFTGLTIILVICHITIAPLPLIAINVGIVSGYVMIVISRQWSAISTACVFFCILSGQKFLSHTFLPIKSDVTVMMMQGEPLLWAILAALALAASLLDD